MENALDHRSRRWRLLSAFAAIYFIWGSTFLAIRFAIETIPPFTMAGIRFVSAGALLYAWCRWRKIAGPTPAQWRAGAFLGFLLLTCGNGGVVWAEQHVPSGLVALMVASIPLWMALLDWLWHGAARPGLWLVSGLIFGFAGIAMLVDLRDLTPGRVDPLSAGVLTLTCFSWAFGSLRSRAANLPPSPRMATAAQLLSGGVLLLALGASSGEWARLDPAAVTARSIFSLAYLSLFGSVVAFTAYVWLLRVASPASVSTYAFVNPVVAVGLGWALADEPLAPMTLLAAAVIVAGVVFITVSKRRSSGRAAGAAAGQGVTAGRSDARGGVAGALPAGEGD